MNNFEAYQYQIKRLTEEEKIQVNVKELNIGRKLSSWEIFNIFKLEPSGNIKTNKRSESDEIESNNWMNQ